MKKWLSIVIGLAAITLAAGSVVAVYPSEFVVITRLGRPVRVIKEPGPAFKLPWPWNR